MTEQPPASRPEGSSKTAVRNVKVPADREGQRLDNFLLGQLKGAPRSLVSVSYTHLDVYKRQQAKNSLTVPPTAPQAPVPA